VDGLFALPCQLLEERAAGGVGEGAKDVIGIGLLHVKNHNRLVMILSREVVLLFR
jgi:hypothetical protein